MTTLTKKRISDAFAKPLDLAHCLLLKDACVYLNKDLSPVSSEELKNSKVVHFIVRVKHPAYFLQKEGYKDEEIKAFRASLAQKLPKLAEEYKLILEKHNISSDSLKVVNKAEDIVHYYNRLRLKHDEGLMSEERKTDFCKSIREDVPIFEFQVKVSGDQLSKLKTIETELKSLKKNSEQFLRSA